MSTFTRHRARAIAALALAASAVPSSPASAVPPKPEIMLLIGSSRTLERPVPIGGRCTVDGCVADPFQDLTSCAPQPVGNGSPPNNANYRPSKMHLIKEALTGGTPGPFVCAEHSECIKDAGAGNPNLCHTAADAMSGGVSLIARTPTNDRTPHMRQWCCSTPGAGVNCNAFVPCGGDTGDITVNGLNLVASHPGANVLTYDPGVGSLVNTDGALYLWRSEVKFGLMTYDAVLPRYEGWRGGFSYPDIGYVKDGQQFSVERAAGQLTEPGLIAIQANQADVNLQNKLGAPINGNFDIFGFYDYTPGDGAWLWRPNLGIQSGQAPYGGLMPSDLGLLNDTLRSVGEGDANVASHNMLVATKVREVVPQGSAPVGAALHDALEYYKRASSDGGDPASACRDRTLVLIGDEAPSHFIGGFRDNQDPTAFCARDADCAAVAGGRCVDLIDEPQKKACRYLPEGYPYRTSAEYAGELYQSGVPVYVIGVAPSLGAQAAFKAIADAGSPGRGAQGRGGYFRADSASQLRDALAKIRNSQVAGMRSHTRPLVLFPRKGDVNAPANVRQWRLNAWSEVPGSTDSYWYGKMERADLACVNAGGPNGDVAARSEIGASEFQAVFNSTPAAPRRVVGRNGNRLFAVSGGAGANAFNDNGTVGAVFTDAEVRTLTGTQAGAQMVNGMDATAQLRAVGYQMNGFFGARGLPDGTGGGLGSRVLGGFVNSDVVAITPPGLPLTLGAYVNYAVAHANRPTMVAAGAGDGMVHIFRADTGAEVVNFVPDGVWPAMRTSGIARTVDGPLDVGDIAVCRKYGVSAPANCPAGLTTDAFRTMLVGGVGETGSDIFGVDVTNTTGLALQGQDQRTNLATFFQGGLAGAARIWDLTPANAPLEFASKLGRSVSRPALTHVRERDAVRSAVIVGCGDDVTGPLTQNTGGVGRCVLVLDAATGEQIALLDNSKLEVSGEGNLDMPMVGSAAVWPRSGIAPADRAYIGDKIGRLWRIDMRSSIPNDWKIRVVWPPVNAQARLGYVTGRTVIGRPAVFAQENGKVAVLFSTGPAAPLQGNPAPPAAAAVSITDGLFTNGLGVTAFAATSNWVFPFGFDELGTGEVAVVGSTALITTAQSGVQVCASATGRMYGVHATDVYRDVNGAPATFLPAPPPQGMPADQRRLTVKPMLPNLREPGKSALSIVLPAGRIAYGVTVAEVPSCVDGEGTSTEVLMNLSDDEKGRRGAPRPADMFLESVDNNGQIRKLRYDDNIFAKSRKTEMSLCLNCGADGKAKGGRQKNAPFSSSVSYWGSTFTE